MERELAFIIRKHEDRVAVITALANNGYKVRVICPSEEGNPTEYFAVSVTIDEKVEASEPDDDCDWGAEDTSKPTKELINRVKIGSKLHTPGR